MTGTHAADDWSAIASLVDALLDTPPERRAALIADLSAGDPGRRSELEGLLAECEREPLLLGRPAAERFAALFVDDVARFPEVLAERYRMTRELGRGGMATVYLARDLKHLRDVAVKVMAPAVATAVGTERFLREIEIIAQLHHPHIMPLYDSGEANGSLYYVMPHEAEASLRQRLARDGPLPVEDAVLILREICDALAHAHRHGIVHRDIKPDNVLLSGGHAMVADFGVAKAATEATGVAAVTALSGVLGTPAYMAPEQIAAHAHVDHRADIYAVGVLAYELLAGRPPFVGAAPRDVLSAHLTEMPEAITTHRPDVSAPLAALVMKCLEKRVADRWQSADELVHRLDAIWRRSSGPDASWPNRWSNARIERLTDFPSSEVDATISSNGQFVAFLTDRDGKFDAFVTRVGSGQFVNLTRGRFHELFNEDVRNIGFSGDATHVWIRVAELTSPARVSIVPTLGGHIRPFISTAATVDWSPDGSKIAYHETTPGDPVYVADSDRGNARRVFIADPGIHNHYLSWSPDGRFLYFSHGIPPDEMDIWRIPSSGGRPERITAHQSRVAYPMLLDDRTLLYTATADDGTGPWLYSVDLDERVARRVLTGVEHYISIAASADAPGQPRRLVATVSNPNVGLWTVPITNAGVDEDAASRMSLPTARAAAPRFGPDSSLLYLASRGGPDGLWRLSGTRSAEMWKPAHGAVVGAAAVSPDGTTVCFPVRRHGRSTLFCTTLDGSDAHALGESLDVRGAGSWSPDGKWIAIAAKEGSGVRVFKVPVDGGSPVRVVDSVSSNPVWSPDGRFIVYSGTPSARNVPVNAVTPDGRPHPLPPLSVDRVGDSYRFLPGRAELVVKLGGFRHQDFWLFDVATGSRRQLTHLRPGESLQRFDVSPNGTQIVFERVRENSDIVLIELPPQ